MPSNGEPRPAVVMDRVRITVPKFSSTNFKAYMEEVEVWTELCGLPKEQQGIMLWFQLPRDHPSDIKEKIINEIGKDDLKKEDGVEKFIAAMNDVFKHMQEITVFNVYTD